MINDLLLIEEPDEQTITVSEHVLRPDGTIRLSLRVEEVHDPAAMLAGVGGEITTAADGTDGTVLVTWSWARPMVPPDEVATCTALVQRALTTWAAHFLGEPIHLHLQP